MAKLIYSAITSLDGYVADEDGNFDWAVPDEEAHAFMTGALGSALADVPQAGERALREAERAIHETLEHHAHVRLRAAAPR